MSENKLSEIIRTSLESIRELADGETVIGNPIATPGGTMVIPVSKVSMGFASGGLDYNGKKSAKEDPPRAQNFGGGGGTGVTVTPIAFLIVAPDGEVRLLPITPPDRPGTVDKVTSLIERSPDILAKLKAVLSSGKKKKTKKDPGCDATDTENAADCVRAEEENRNATDDNEK